MANPVGYTLWCDYFERQDRVHEAWNAMVQKPIGDSQIERILDASGPVRWELKSSLFRVLLSEDKWHRHIYLSIYHNKHGFYGEVDDTEAKRILHELHIPEETPGLSELKREFE